MDNSCPFLHLYCNCKQKIGETTLAYVNIIKTATANKKNSRYNSWPSFFHFYIHKCIMKHSRDNSLPIYISISSTASQKKVGTTLAHLHFYCKPKISRDNSCTTANQNIVGTTFAHFYIHNCKQKIGRQLLLMSTLLYWQLQIKNVLTTLARLHISISATAN